MKVVIQKNIKTIFLVVLLIKLFVLMIDLVNQLLYIGVKIQLINLLKELLKNIAKIINKHFNKNLIMAEEEENLFQKSNNCWICKKLIDNDEDKVRDHCHISGKFRGAAHKRCNLNFNIS